MSVRSEVEVVRAAGARLGDELATLMPSNGTCRVPAASGPSARSWRTWPSGRTPTPT